MSDLSTDSINVLHVDDDPAFVDMSAEFLAKKDERLTVETATSAREGMDRLADGRVDCIVSDYDMPRKNGVEFLKHVRENHPNLPFILFTGKGSEEVAADAISAGVTDYLQKAPGSDQFTVLANRITNAVDKFHSDKELERLNDLFGRAQKIANIGVWEADLQSNEGWWSEQVSRIFGLPPEETGGIGAGLEYFHPDDRPIIEEAFDRALEEGEPYDLEVRLTGEDGVDRWVRARANPSIVDGEVALVRGTFQDITARKGRERHLQLMEQLVEEMNDGAVIAQEGEIKLINPHISDLVGYAEEELIGKPLAEFIAPEHQEIVEQRHRTRLSGDGESVPEMYEIAILSKSGGRVPGEINVTRIKYKGQPATLSLVRDISGRRKREQKLQRQNERLEGLASIVSHDLRNPLNVVEGRLNLAQQECQCEHLDHATNALERSFSLIDDLLTVAREGEIEAEVEQTDLAELFEECWLTVKTGNADFVVNTNQTIQADPSKLRRLIENLIQNAVEHGGDEVTITLGEQEGGFYIADDGPGIADEDRTRIFEYGYTSEEERTGFGLAIVQEIVDAHEWDINVTSGVENGARFEITRVGESITTHS